MKAGPMRHRMKLAATPDPKFAEAATIIAKCPPPQWLLLGLDHFSTFVAGQPITTKVANELRPIFEKMHRELKHLIKWLPALQRMPLLESPDDVAVALDVLPRIREAVAVVANSPRKKRPNVPHKTCAAVVVEAWTLIHGRPNPLPDQLRSACQAYWEACGGGEGGIENWVRHAKEAAAIDNVWIREVLSAYTSR
jgi:hypothetical protein